MKISPSLLKKTLYTVAGLLGTVLGYGAQQVWADTKANTTSVAELKTARESEAELLRETRTDVREMRADVREIRDALRRQEGGRDVSRAP